MEHSFSDAESLPDESWEGQGQGAARAQDGRVGSLLTHNLAIFRLAPRGKAASFFCFGFYFCFVAAFLMTFLIGKLCFLVKISHIQKKDKENKNHM